MIQRFKKNTDMYKNSATLSTYTNKEILVEQMDAPQRMLRLNSTTKTIELEHNTIIYHVQQNQGVVTPTKMFKIEHADSVHIC